MSLHALATDMASKGRNGDSMLVHMTPGEVRGLQALALKHGGTLTTNPDTGLPEANFLKSILPILAGLALGPAGMGIAFGGLSSAASAGLLVGGVTGLATGSLSKGLMAGLGAYGGAGLGGGLSDLGAGELAQGQISANMPTLAEGATQSQIADYAQQVKDLRTAGLQGASQLPMADKLSAGFSSATASPTDALAFAKQNMVPLGMAASPIMADMMVPTTTKTASPMAPGRIREKRWNGQYFEDVASTDAGVYNTSGRNFSDLYRGYNNGGIVALAEGGMPHFAGATGSLVAPTVKDASGYDQSVINAALAAELGSKSGQGASLDSLRSYAKTGYNLSDAQINAAFDTIPGFNAQGQFDEADYGTSSVNGIKNTQAQVDAAKLYRDAEYAKNMDFLKNNSIQHSVLDEATGKRVQLNQYHPDFDPTNQTTLAALGQKVLGNDTGASNFFLSNPQYRPLADAAWAKEKARLDAIDRAAGRLPALNADVKTDANKGLADLNQNQNLLTNQDQNKDKNANTGLAALDAGKSQTYKWFEERGLGFTPIHKVIDNWFDQYTDDLALLPPSKQVAEMEDALKVSGMNEADLVKATGKTIKDWIQIKTGNIKDVTSTYLPDGVSGGGNTVLNANGTVTTKPDLTLPMRDVRDAYTEGGGSLGFTSRSFDTIEVFNKTYVDDRMSGDSLAAYEFLSGKKGAKYPTKSGVGRIAEPYDEAVLGYPARGNLPFTYDKATGKMVRNMDYVAPGRDEKGNVTYGMSLNDVKKYLTDTPLSGQSLYDWAQTNKVSAQQIADATGRSLSSVYADFRKGATAKAAVTNADGTIDETKVAKQVEDNFDEAAYLKAHPSVAEELRTGKSVSGQPVLFTSGYDHYVKYGKDAGWEPTKKAARGGIMGYAMGGMPSYALGGLGNLGGYSDGGRLLRGPGDGVSDSIPATIGRKQQPARLADGEFVVPARIVSELGNGSTDAGAKKLYAMMDRVQRARGKTTGKNKVAANSRADKYLPA